MKTAIYRARQFFRGFRTTLAPHEIGLVHARLSEAERELFDAMQAGDQRHSVDLALWLGPEASDTLLTAALLHDVGKGPVHVWDRIVFVLLGGLGDRARGWLEAERGGRFRRALWRLEHHAALGAALLRAAGSSPRVVELVERHTAAPPHDDEELSRLIAADEAT
ncbi:MAG: HD domain-containing protein [Chloroflexi bacterium]|nr:MAG: HD domain-containing protein [Chloroflexota bacterium]